MAPGQAELESTSTVVTVLLTGAFILPAIGISPILNIAFEWFFQRPAPTYYNFAIGAVGAYTIFYLVFYVSVVVPVNCARELSFDYRYRVDLTNLQLIDFLNVWLVYVVYLSLLWRFEIQGMAAFIGGFAIIISSLVFQVVPRVVGRWFKRDCFWTLKILIVSIPISLSVFIPAMWLVFELT